MATNTVLTVDAGKTNISSEKGMLDSPTQSGVDATSVNELHNEELSRRVTRKTDIRLMPMLCMLYLTAYLDRTNIANARLLGLEKELNMPSNGYNTALWMFYLSFVLLEAPSNLLLTWSKLTPNIWLGTSMSLLGVVTLCQGFVHSPGALYACRFIMGIFEGALSPAAALLIGQYYRRHEFGIRYALFSSFALVGASFSSFLAYAINFMNGAQGISSWRWIFILEGTFNVFVALFAFFVLPKFPADSTFLTPEEKEHLIARLEAERGHESMSLRGISSRTLLGYFLNWNVWLNTLAYFGADISASAISAFSPTILSQLGWTANQANLRNVPIWLVGAIISLAVAYAAGRTGQRIHFIFAGFCMCLTGWCIQYSQVKPPAVRYFALYLIASGSFLQLPLLVSWLSSNVLGGPQKAISHALQIGFGNSANFVSSNVFIKGQAPRYKTGFTTGIVVTLVGGMALMANAALLWNENRKADKKEKETGVATAVQGESELRFRYII